MNRANYLLKFLFEDSQQPRVQSTRRRQEDAAFEAYLGTLSEELGVLKDLETKKAPLQKALKSAGITGGELSTTPERGYILSFDDAGKYHDAMAVIRSPDGMHALAELGWLAADIGDVASRDHELLINFIAVTGDEEGSDEEKKSSLEKSDMEKIAKDSYDFVNDPLPDREDVKATDDNNKGVGKATDGPKPKGVKSRAESLLREVLNGKERPSRPLSLPSPKRVYESLLPDRLAERQLKRRHNKS